ncbi:MAG: hypothetical protein ACYC8S_00240 [Minisyncoccota bacterium]
MTGKTDKVVYSIVGIAGAALITGLVFIKSNGTPQPARVTTATKDAGMPRDPEDIVPGMYANQIKNSATTSGLSIVSGLVENNVDTQGKITDDHLEVLLKNSSAQDMSNFEVYYVITDLATGKREGYYKKLSGFILKKGGSKSVHFDGKSGVDHFGVNKDGLYFTSKNKLQFDIQVSTLGFQVAHLQILKDAGGAELKD